MEAWKVENAARTLQEAARIRRQPKLRKAAIAEIKKQQKDNAEIISVRR